MNIFAILTRVAKIVQRIKYFAIGESSEKSQTYRS